MYLISLAVLTALATGMGITASYILYLSRFHESPVRIVIVYLLLAMMNGMLLGPAIYFFEFHNFSAENVIILSLGIMSLEMVYPLILFIRHFENSLVQVKVSTLIIIFVTLLNEFLMSFDFNSYISGQFFRYVSPFSTLSIIFNSISSFWFIFPMALEMFLTALLSIRKTDKSPFIFITFQSVIMFLTPTALNYSQWLFFSVFAGGAIMTTLLVYLFESLYRQNFLTGGFARYIILIILTYSLMMGGILLYQYDYVNSIVSIAIIVEMIIYLYAIINASYFKGGKKVYWLANRRWSTAFLISIFIAEFGMGATFDFQYFGPGTFINAMSLTAISGSAYGIMLSFLYDVVIVIGSITGSSWFLIMMGFEMGSLVVFKILKTRELENKIRLSLTIFAYAIYSILIPSFIIPNAQIYPFIGWSMGIGAGGGLAPYLIVPMLLTYFISGMLSLLFGARQLCSVFCTAPLMYQGTFYDSMKKFNRTSPTARYISREGERNKIYRVVSLTVYTSLAIGALFSILNSYHIFGISIYGTDPLFFIYILLFDFMWYAVFLTMPYFGNYGCINTGYCHWGNFNRWISKFGFFRLKVNDPMQCVNCKTKDCATACPVGLSTQPGNFISTGEFKNSRCVGIGDCVEACPYENIFFYDVRHFIRDRLRKKN